MEIFKNSKYSKKFQEIMDRFKNEKINKPQVPGSVPGVWVSKLVSKRDWANHYSFIPSYYYLGEEIGRVKTGFIVAYKVPFGCKALTELEKIKINNLKKQEHYDFIETKE